jgi:hypothetical protein
LKDTLAATSVILLFDPEHVTAANYRKQHLRDAFNKADSGREDAPMGFVEGFGSEIWFLNCILASPLHRQTKSPTLWYHRFWVYNALHGRNLPTWPHSVLTRELDVIFKAAERHQHNYYAFQYARRIVHPDFEGAVDEEALKTRVDCPGSRVWREEYYNSRLSHAQAAYLPLLERSASWCKSHPSDTSGWSFLLFMMQKLRLPESNGKVIQATLKFAVGMQWKGQALWHFMRTIADSDCVFLVPNEKEDLVRTIRDAMAEWCPFPAP